MNLSPFHFQARTGILFGPGKARQIAPELDSLAPGVRRVLIVTDAGVRGAGLLEGPAGSLKEAGIGVEIFDRVAPDPGSAQVDEIAGLIRSFKPRVVVGVGGGSPMDAAKLAASAAAEELGEDKGCECFACCAEKLPQRTVALVMIPTTAGTGAEVTRTAIFSDPRGRKVWAWGDTLAPDLALLDPELTSALPPGLTAATGLDALVHAIEGATSRRADPLSRAFGLEAVRLALPGLRKVMKNPGDMEARACLSVGACLAGLAIDQAGTGLAHALGHVLSNLQGLHHGTAVALAERVVLPFNAEADPDLHQALIRDLAGPAGEARSAGRAWAGLLELCGLNGSIDTGPDGVSVEEIVEGCLAPENLPMVENNSREVGREELAGLVERLLSL